MNRFLLAACACAISAPATAMSVDLTDWQVERSSAGQGTPTWTVGANGQSVTQSQNGSASVFYDPVGSALNTEFSGVFTSVVTADDDFSGIVIGFNAGELSGASATSDYFLLDWKEGTQTYNGITAGAGLALSHVTGASTEFMDLWGHQGSVTEIARGANLGSTGFVDLTDYAIDIVYTEDLLEISVDGQSEITYTAAEHGSKFSDGGYGLYAFTQPGVSFSDVEIVAMAPEPTTVPVPAALPMMIGAMGLFAAIRRR